jgi:hypothetical protein
MSRSEGDSSIQDEATGGVARPDQSSSRRDPGTHDAAALLPNSEQTLLLRACLYSGEAGRGAWTACRETGGDLLRRFREDETSRSLAVLLLDAVRRNALPVERRLHTVLRTAYLREELRSRELRAILAEILSILSAQGMTAILRRGTAAAETVYAEPHLRHTHGLELWLPPEAMLRAVDALAPRAFQPSSPEVASPPESSGSQSAITLVHRSGVPLRLGSGIAGLPPHHPVIGKMVRRSEGCSLLGTPARVLTTADALLDVCAQSPEENWDGLLWVCDAWLTLHRRPGLDPRAWRRLPLPAPLGPLLFSRLSYLARELEIPIEHTGLEALNSWAAGSSEVRVTSFPSGRRSDSVHEGVSAGPPSSHA